MCRNWNFGNYEYTSPPREGYLLKDRQEHFNLKRAWYVNAWRIVDKDKKDLVQPWADTKKEALDTAKELNITILGTL